MTENQSSDSRRKLLKSISLGSGVVIAGKSLPDSWSKPVVDSILLPSHAATTDDTGNLPTATTAAPITTIPPCTAVDDEFIPTDINEGDGSVPAPGVLANDSCTQVVSNTDAIVIGQGGLVVALNVNADGSFNYTVTAPDTIFTFTYTTESGATATVTVSHDIFAR